MTDRELMQIAIAEAEKSRPEDQAPRPRVGVVIAKDGEILAQAHRNENGGGAHAEFIAIEKLLSSGKTAEGATAFTTLEPCTYRRSKNKIPCAQRLVDEKVARVVYGMIDPHTTVQSKGILLLRTNQIETESFDSDLLPAIEKLNESFINAFTKGQASAEFINANRERSLDDWYLALNRIYWHQNLQKSPADLFGHLVETIAGASLLATNKTTTRVKPHSFVLKALAWWLALCGRLRVSSVEKLVWAKFPGVCPYCQSSPHVATCKSHGQHPDWEQLRKVGDTKEKPVSLRGWQDMFRQIYPGTNLLSAGGVYLYLMEELGELAEAVRVFDVAPGLFLNEAPDVFAWIMQVQTSIDAKAEKHDDYIGTGFCKAYPDLCPYCAAESCECPGVLPSTVGRLGGAISPTTFGANGHGTDAFLSVDKAAKLFEF